MSKKILNVGLLYVAFHNQLVKKYGENSIVLRKEINEKIGRFQHIQKNLRGVIIKEMQNKGLLEKINRDNFKINPLIINIETEKNKLYQLVDIY